MTLDRATEARDLGIEFGKPKGPTVNGGGGVLVRLHSRVNLDLGATFGYTRFKSVSVTIPGEGVFSADFGNGTNLVVRLGLAIGIGG